MADEGLVERLRAAERLCRGSADVWKNGGVIDPYCEPLCLERAADAIRDALATLSPSAGEDEVERVARALYERNPRYDQETDLDGRPTTAPYQISWDDLPEHDSGHHEDILEDARAAIASLSHTRLRALEEALAKAAERFREYERHHRAKLPTKGLRASLGMLSEDESNSQDKAVRNREMAEMCEAALARAALGLGSEGGGG